MKEYLSKLEWTIVAGDPPHGTDHIPVFEMHDSDYVGKGSKGSKKIDLLAYKKKYFLLIELKGKYADDQTEGDWFKARSKLFDDAEIVIIQRKNNPEYIQKLLKYDRPDIILVKEGVPKLVIEKTREVPTGHNVGQRFARLVNAVENGIPIIFFLPFKATKHGKHQGVCSIPIRIFDAIDRMGEIHKVDTLITSWDTDDDNELLVDGTENNYLDKVINELIQHNFNFSQSYTIKEIKKRNNEFKSLTDSRTRNPPKSVNIKKTIDYVKYLNDNNKLSFEQQNELNKTFSKRQDTLVYKIGMTESKCNRQDPYVGQQFLYDYQYCRFGHTPNMKKMNLCLYFPNILQSVWLKKNPNNPNTKDSVWYVTAKI